MKFSLFLILLVSTAQTLLAESPAELYAEYHKDLASKKNENKLDDRSSIDKFNTLWANEFRRKLSESGNTDPGYFQIMQELAALASATQRNQEAIELYGFILKNNKNIGLQQSLANLSTKANLEFIEWKQADADRFLVASDNTFFQLTELISSNLQLLTLERIDSLLNSYPMILEEFPDKKLSTQRIESLITVITDSIKSLGTEAVPDDWSSLVPYLKTSIKLHLENENQEIAAARFNSLMKFGMPKSSMLQNHIWYVEQLHPMDVNAQILLMQAFLEQLPNDIDATHYRYALLKKLFQEHRFAEVISFGSDAMKTPSNFISKSDTSPKGAQMTKIIEIVAQSFRQLGDEERASALEKSLENLHKKHRE